MGLRRYFPLVFARWSYRQSVMVVLYLFGLFWPNQKVHKKLSSELSEYYPKSDLVLIDSARSGLKMALQACQLKQPNKNIVLVPSYVCPAVTQVIDELGLIAQEIDIGHDYNIAIDKTIQASESDNAILALVAVHMFGALLNVPALEAHCKQAGVFIIDDAAQLFGEYYSDGRHVGSAGDFGLLSFAQSKSLISGHKASGGVLINNQPKVFDSLPGLLPANENRRWELAEFLLCFVLLSRWPTLSYYLQRFFSKRTQTSPSVHYAQRAISNIDAFLVLIQIKNFAESKQARLNSYKAITACLDKVQGNWHHQESHSEYVTRYVIHSDKEAIQRLKSSLESAGIATRVPYSASLNIDRQERYLLEIPLRQDTEYLARLEACLAGVSLNIE